MRVSKKIEGPFFAHDPEKTFHQNAARMIHAIVDVGQGQVVSELGKGERDRLEVSRIGGRVSDHVEARMKKVSGKPPIGRVFVRNEGFTGPEGKALMAAASRVEAKTHAFRRVAARMRASRQANLEELLKGIQ